MRCLMCDSYTFFDAIDEFRDHVFLMHPETAPNAEARLTAKKRVVARVEAKLKTEGWLV